LQGTYSELFLLFLQKICDYEIFIIDSMRADGISAIASVRADEFLLVASVRADEFLLVASVSADEFLLVASVLAGFPRQKGASASSHRPVNAAHRLYYTL